MRKHLYEYMYQKENRIIEPFWFIVGILVGIFLVGGVLLACVFAWWAIL